MFFQRKTATFKGDWFSKKFTYRNVSIKRHKVSFAWSICNHYCRFENIGRFVTLKKNQVQNMGSLPLLFLNNNGPGFCTLVFAPHILDLILFKFQTLKKYQVDLINLITGCRLIGRVSLGFIVCVQCCKMVDITAHW